MSRQIGSLHRSNSHPANLQNPIHIIPLFAFPPPDSPRTNTSSGMNSDTNSDITVFQTKSQFNNSDLETSDEFADSEPSPSTHTQTPSSTLSKSSFQPIQPQNQGTSPYTPSQVTPTYSPFYHEQSINHSPDNFQISYELDNFITLQQQLIPPTLSRLTNYHQRSHHQIHQPLHQFQIPLHHSLNPPLQQKHPLVLTELIEPLNANFQITRFHPNPEPPENT